MNYRSESDATLFIRFFAKCTLALGLMSTAWAVYISIWYPVNTQAATQRIAFCVSLVIGGIAALWAYPKKHQRHKTLRESMGDIAMRLEGIVFYLSIPAIAALLLFTLYSVFPLENLTVDPQKFASVKVRVDSIELHQVDPEFIKSHEPWKEVFDLPEKIIELWIARGQVTILEVDGKAIEPMISQGLFTIPSMTSYGKRRIFIEHHQMDAAMDSERYEISSTYPAWVLRDLRSEVYFELPSDRRLRSLKILVCLNLVVSLYLFIRIAIGRKVGDQHWVALKNIISTNNPTN